MGERGWVLGFRVWVWVLRVWGLGFRVSGLGFRIWGLGFRLWGLGFRFRFGVVANLELEAADASNHYTRLLMSQEMMLGLGFGFGVSGIRVWGLRALTSASPLNP